MWAVRAKRKRRRGAGALALLAGFAALTAACSYSIDLEPLKSAAESSSITAADGSVLATLDMGEHRVNVSYGRIAPVLRNAVVAIEDHRFFEHSGVDVHAVLRALERDASKGEVVE